MLSYSRDVVAERPQSIVHPQAARQVAARAALRAVTPQVLQAAAHPVAVHPVAALPVVLDL